MWDQTYLFDLLDRHHHSKTLTRIQANIIVKTAFSEVLNLLPICRNLKKTSPYEENNYTHCNCSHHGTVLYTMKTHTQGNSLQPFTHLLNIHDKISTYFVTQFTILNVTECCSELYIKSSQIISGYK